MMLIVDNINWKPQGDSCLFEVKMKPVLFGYLITLFVTFLDARRFRCDYTYVKEADGYLKYQEIPASWHDARLRCQLEGTILASPLNQGMKAAMDQMVNGTCDRGVWTGIHSTFSKGDYNSMEGVPLSEIPHSWTKCEPDNDQDQEGCIVQLPNGRFADANCNETLPYFCYQKVYTGMVMNSCGSMDNEYFLDKTTKKCYKFHKHGRTWKQAFSACQAEGGHLAIINNDAEAQAIKDIFNKYPANSLPPEQVNDVAFLGFHIWPEAVVEYKTIHGQTLKEAGYEKWAPGEPNNYNGQRCGAVYRTGLLDNAWCENRASFICEKDPENLMCGHDRK